MQHVLTVLIVLALGFPALQLPAVFQRVILRPLLSQEPRALWLIGGLLAGIVTCLAIRRSSRVRFLTTLQHELSHMATALVLGTSPRSLSAGEHAGLFQYQLGGPVPKVRAFFITISPYWFSPLILAPVVLSLVVPSPHGWRMGLIAWLLGICLTLPLAEIRPHQTDLKRYGLVPPILAALWLWAGLAALTLTLLPASTLSSVVGLYEPGWQFLISFVE